MDKEQGKLEWPKEAVLEMVQMWEKYECLYNPKHKFYHNKHARYSALNEMADSLKVYIPAVGAAEIRTKMTYLRGQYTREHSRANERKSGAGADDVYVPGAYWYNELSFLNDFIKVRKGGSNLCDDNSQQTGDSLDSSLLDNEPSVSQPNKRRRLSSDTPQSSHSPMSQEYSVLTAATTALQNIASSRKKSEGEVKHEAFCNYINSELNALTNDRIRDELMERITLAVFDAKKKERMSKESDVTFSNFD